MNQFDILSRNLTKLVDSQTMREPAIASEGADGNQQSAETDSFDTLLKGMSDKGSGNEALARSSGDPVQVEAQPTGNASGPVDTGIANAVFALLQGIVPNAGPQPSTALPLNGAEQDEGASPQALLEGMLASQDDSEISSLVPEPKMTVAVRHQETHFKPVMERIETELAAKGQSEIDVSSDGTLDPEIPGKASLPVHTEKQSASRESRPHVQVAAPSQVATELKSDSAESMAETGEQAVSSLGEALQARKEAPSQAAKHEPMTHLPSENLHRMAGAIKAEAQSMTGSASSPPLHAEGGLQTISVKASESALRVLNLQLHPAHLGTVTVKMRLAGESLEMELHVESEETAQLLKTDAEKLSSLLRGSGYRPDMISIHVSDIVMQERMAAARSQPDMQAQGQSFHQGGASHDERSRNRGNQHASAGAEHQKHADEKPILDSRGAGGVYL